MKGQKKQFCPRAAISCAQCVCVSRIQDEEFWHALRHGDHCNLHAARQSGKTTLTYKTIQRLEKEGNLCIDIDLSTHAHMASMLTMIASMGQEIGAELGFRYEASQTGSSIIDAWLCCLEAIAGHIPSGKRLYFFIDEFDIIRRFSQSDVADFFIATRDFINTCHCAEHSNVVITLISVLTPNEYFMDVDLGGFSCSCFRDIYLPSFCSDDAVVAQLAEGFEHTDSSLVSRIVRKILHLSGGHPYLTTLFCSILCEKTEDLDDGFNALEYDVLNSVQSCVYSHITGMRRQLLDYDARLYSMMKAFHRIQMRTFEPDTFSPTDLGPLENVGLIHRDGTGNIIVSNPIYNRWFNATWQKSLLDEFDQKRDVSRKGKSAKIATRKRIALLITGGTIGMRHDEREGKAVFPQQEEYEELLKPILKQISDIVKVSIVPICQKDGINMTPRDWIDIIDSIESIQKNKNYNGVVIAHGTDTMAFTASATAFALGSGIDIPIVFTGAQATINNVHGDTAMNLIRACFVAAQDEKTRIKEVVICFDDQVYRACRAQKKDDARFDGFESPAWPALAKITEDLLVNKIALLPEGNRDTEFLCRPHFAETILNLNIVPGLKPFLFESLLEQNKLDGIILSSPGVGNIPSEREYNFRSFIEKANEQHIPVLITSQIPINPYTAAQYEMALAPLIHGAIPAGNMTQAAAITKFSWVLGIQRASYGHEQWAERLDFIKNTMAQNCVGEIGEFGDSEK